MKKLKNIITWVALLMVTLVATAQEVNFRRVENAHIIDAVTLDTLSSHSSDTEAQQQLLNWQFANREVYMAGARYAVDVKTVSTVQITDTIYVGDDWTGLTNMYVVDTITKLFFKYGNVSSPTTNVLNQMGDLYIVEKDSSLSIPNYVFQAKLERYKTWPTAETTYKLIETPFFFYKSDSIVSKLDSVLRIRTFANAHHCIVYKINDSIVIGPWCNPGVSEFAGGSRRHTGTIPGLDFSQENRIEAIAQDSLGVELGSRSILIEASPALRWEKNDYTIDPINPLRIQLKSYLNKDHRPVYYLNGSLYADYNHPNSAATPQVDGTFMTSYTITGIAGLNTILIKMYDKEDGVSTSSIEFEISL